MEMDTASGRGYLGLQRRDGVGMEFESLSRGGSRGWDAAGRRFFFCGEIIEFLSNNMW